MTTLHSIERAKERIGMNLPQSIQGNQSEDSQERKKAYVC